jgi:hypothetical protein
MNHAMSNAELQRVAPSIFATEPWSGVSAKYGFIPTIGIVDALRAEGFEPVHASQSTTRVEGKADFTKHMIRFQRTADIVERPRVVNGNAHYFYESHGEVAPYIPQVVMTNAHDLTGAFVLDAGLFRLLCSNGLMVSSGSFGSVRRRHSGNVGDVIDGVFSIVKEFPQVLGQVEQWQKIALTAHQQAAYATAAAELRWGDNVPVDPVKLLTVRRSGDNKNDVFTTFNRVQEAIVKGGVRGRGQTGRRLTTRAIKGVTEDVRLNKALWRLTEELAKQV